MTDSRRDWVMAACGAKPGAVEDYPFGDEVAVFKVVGRMFALVPLGESPGSVSLKCDPDLAISLRDRYAGVTPGYHLNKRHWNTVTLDGSVPEEDVRDFIDHSYDLVVARLTKSERNRLMRLPWMRTLLRRFIPRPRIPRQRAELVTPGRQPERRPRSSRPPLVEASIAQSMPPRRTRSRNR